MLPGNQERARALLDAGALSSIAATFHDEIRSGEFPFDVESMITSGRGLHDFAMTLIGDRVRAMVRAAGGLPDDPKQQAAIILNMLDALGGGLDDEL